MEKYFIPQNYFFLLFLYVRANSFVSTTLNTGIKYYMYEYIQVIQESLLHSGNGLMQALYDLCTYCKYKFIFYLSCLKIKYTNVCFVKLAAS